MTNITQRMNSYRECSRNLWNTYFANREHVGDCLDAFGQIRELLFDFLVVNDLPCAEVVESEDIPPPVLQVVPRANSLILIERLSGPGEAGYWDQEKDMVVGPDDIKLAFVDYFDFSQAPIQDFHYFRCKILSFPLHPDYKGREALVKALDAEVFHDELADQRNKGLIP